MIPTEPQPPTTVGLSPKTADEVNYSVGSLLRQFTNVKESISRSQEWFASADLKIPPYSMTADQETLIKSAMTDLDTDLDAVDMTFIVRLTGLY